MIERLAIKRLSPSDLTLFEWQFKNRNAGNQKSVNLNAKVFVDQLYPFLPLVSSETGNEVRVSLTLLGPNGKNAYPLARKITKASESYKNWRLNGEFIFNPLEDPERFNILEDGDLCLMAFSGDPVPTKLEALFLSARSSRDKQLHARLIGLVPSKGQSSMAVLPANHLSELVGDLPEAKHHPVQRFLVDDELAAAIESIALGDARPIEKLRKRRGRSVSALELAKAKKTAERVGRDGEGLVHHYLTQQIDCETLSNIEWVSSVNATAPFDFIAEDNEGNSVRIDAKSTEGPFSRKLHISSAEIEAASDLSIPYVIYRVYGIHEDGAFLRISKPIGGLATSVQASVKLPDGVSPDSYSIDPDVLEWGNELTLDRPDDVGLE